MNDGEDDNIDRSSRSYWVIYRPHEALGYNVSTNYYKLENMVGLTLNSK